jgi:hypothetical protein
MRGREYTMETAAAILTQLLYTSDVFASKFEIVFGNQGILPGSSGQSLPERLATEVKPYYEAMLKMVRETDAKL